MSRRVHHEPVKATDVWTPDDDDSLADDLRFRDVASLVGVGFGGFGLLVCLVLLVVGVVVWA